MVCLCWGHVIILLLFCGSSLSWWRAAPLFMSCLWLTFHIPRWRRQCGRFPSNFNRRILIRGTLGCFAMRMYEWRRKYSPFLCNMYMKDVFLIRFIKEMYLVHPEPGLEITNIKASTKLFWLAEVCAKETPHGCDKDLARGWRMARPCVGNHGLSDMLIHPFWTRSGWCVNIIWAHRAVQGRDTPPSVYYCVSCNT